MRSADAIRSMRLMAEERGMIVGAREARLVNKVGVLRDKEKGVEERGGWDPSSSSGDAGVAREA